MTQRVSTRAARPSPGAAHAASLDYVTVMIGEQMLGLPIERVNDVFIATRFTPVPRAPQDIVGLLNLRGRVVTAICLRKRLGIQPVVECRENGRCELVSVGVEDAGEPYALIVDAVGEVTRLDRSTLEPVPVNLDPTWAALASGVHRLEDRLLVILDVDAVLSIEIPVAA
jgi:purine-binding chemotaxis protein CheW